MRYTERRTSCRLGFCKTCASSKKHSCSFDSAADRRSASVLGKVRFSNAPSWNSSHAMRRALRAGMCGASGRADRLQDGRVDLLATHDAGGGGDLDAAVGPFELEFGA